MKILYVINKNLSYDHTWSARRGRRNRAWLGTFFLFLFFQPSYMQSYYATLISTSGIPVELCLFCYYIYIYEKYISVDRNRKIDSTYHADSNWLSCRKVFSQCFCVFLLFVYIPIYFIRNDILT